MKRWLLVAVACLLCYASGRAGTGELPDDKQSKFLQFVNEIRQRREHGMNVPMLETECLIAGTARAGVFHVAPYPYGSEVTLSSRGWQHSVSMIITKDGPCISARSHDKKVMIPIFTLAEHLGIPAIEHPPQPELP